MALSRRIVLAGIASLVVAGCSVSSGPPSLGPGPDPELITPDAGTYVGTLNGTQLFANVIYGEGRVRMISVNSPGGANGLFEPAGGPRYVANNGQRIIVDSARRITWFSPNGSRVIYRKQ
ncbi:MAG: hypothetical protein AAGG69_08470 [Pseudomonadota bacterium]